MRKIISILVTTMAVASTNQFANAQDYTSAYTELNFDQHCTILSRYELGVSAKCTGYTPPGMGPDAQWPIYFAEGDLRQMVRFGHVNEETDQWQSFGQFNQVGKTVEWRLSNGKPIATILRWFVDSENPQTGAHEEGQVLVVSTVANHSDPNNGCVVGYVDARANSNANVLARNVADSIAGHFQCNSDNPKFYGERGPNSGTPTGMGR